MSNELTVNQGFQEEPILRDKNRGEPWQIILGIVCIVGIFWLFLPKFGGPEYDPLEITESNKNSIVEHYEHGNITIAGKKYYDLDVVVFPDRVKSGWHGMKDHQLFADEIDDIINEGIKTVVIGTGSLEHAFVMQDTRQRLESNGINTHILGTYKAVDFYNKHPKENIIAIFHLTE